MKKILLFLVLFILISLLLYACDKDDVSVNESLDSESVVSSDIPASSSQPSQSESSSEDSSSAPEESSVTESGEESSEEESLFFKSSPLYKVALFRNIDQFITVTNSINPDRYPRADEYPEIAGDEYVYRYSEALGGVVSQVQKENYIIVPFYDGTMINVSGEREYEYAYVGYYQAGVLDESFEHGSFTCNFFADDGYFQFKVTYPFEESVKIMNEQGLSQYLMYKYPQYGGFDNTIQEFQKGERPGYIDIKYKDIVIDGVTLTCHYYLEYNILDESLSANLRFVYDNKLIEFKSHSRSIYKDIEEHFTFVKIPLK